PPRGMDTTGYTPYAVSVAVVYIIKLIFLALAVHGLASALEYVLPSPHLGRRDWKIGLLPPDPSPPVGRGENHVAQPALVAAAHAPRSGLLAAHWSYA